MKFIPINTTGAQPYNRSGKVLTVDFCCGFTATNTGDTIVKINGRVLYPGTIGTNNGDSFTFGCNYMEQYVGNIDVIFNAGGAFPEITIEQRFYCVEP